MVVVIGFVDDVVILFWVCWGEGIGFGNGDG